jgi:hypothetical protein
MSWPVTDVSGPYTSFELSPRAAFRLRAASLRLAATQRESGVFSRILSEGHIVGSTSMPTAQMLLLVDEKGSRPCL